MEFCLVQTLNGVIIKSNDYFALGSSSKASITPIIINARILKRTEQVLFKFLKHTQNKITINYIHLYDILWFYQNMTLTSKNNMVWFTCLPSA